MQNNNEEPDNLTNTLKKKQTKVFDDVSKNYEQTLEVGKHLGKESFDKINELASNGTNYIKSKPYWKAIKNNSLKIKEKSFDSGTAIKKKSPKFYKKISNAFFSFFEKFVGRIKIGTQYGLENLEILERLAKLNELGILTDEEFLKQKKKILERI
ncbi:MAG: SHOCT domain-containing protein [Nitrosopumilus sp.]|uniref:SHOCT domain-containing protein n=1 Tax=Nitrosopumilus sp. TaxID=2024843 RepID=UPI00247BBA8E|nr:SHOCT domain-containing protein [Nitrosopumilus sp.]MCV0392129.1 SHOCT domain-containing protein [Nitrosopumilus sp.]